jgi:tRNA(His) 5'-end guanylyltransferase
MKNDEYGDRMKSYEYVTRTVLPPRTYTIVRVDGRAFHTHLRKAEKPFDEAVITAMQDAAVALCKEMGGARFAYTQSDEISVLLTDLDPKAQAWFGGQIQKICSVAASIATAVFNESYIGLQYDDRIPSDPATFDARVYTIPDRTEVMNYFRWRQEDAIKNAVSMAAQAAFSHKELHGLNGAQMQEKLFQEREINFRTHYSDGERRGWLVNKRAFTVAATNPTPTAAVKWTEGNALRTEWHAIAAPEFRISTLPNVVTAISDLVPSNGSGPAQSDYVTLFGYPIGQAVLATATVPAGALWAAEQIREEMEDDQIFRLWMSGMNPSLDDKNPLTELLAGNIKDVLAAFRAYKSGDFA